MRAAIATCLLEQLLEHHFDQFIRRVEESAKADFLFGQMTAMCRKFGNSQD